jgi:hypothetical protein
MMPAGSYVGPELTVGILYEPADWTFTIRDWAQGGLPAVGH